MQATYELNRVALLVTDPPVLTLPLGKVFTFFINSSLEILTRNWEPESIGSIL